MSRALVLLERAALPALAFLISIAYWPGTVGAVYTPRWMIMAFIVALLFLRPVQVTGAHLTGALFVAWSLLTLFWSASPQDTVGESYRLLMVAAAFCVGSQQTSLRPVYAAMAAGLGLCAVVAVLQLSGIDLGIIDNASPSALFGNRNFYAEIAALLLVALIAERMWWLTLPVLPGLLLTGTRGALLGTAVGLFAAFRHAVSVPRWLAVLGLGAAAGLIIGIPLHADGFATISVRLDYWAHVVENLSLFGQGAGTFGSTLPTLTGQRWEHSHNEFLEIAYETGFFGLVVFLFFAASLYRAATKAGQAETCLVLALLVESLVSFPLHNPATVCLGALAAGYLARNLAAVLDPASPSGISRHARQQRA